MTEFEAHEIHYYQNQESPEYSPATIGHEHLNNFGLRLPGSAQRPSLEQEELKTFREILGDSCGYSPLALSQTPKEFFESIDRAIVQASIPRDMIEKLGSYVVKTDSAMTPEEVDLEKQVFKIYEILRKKVIISVN